MSSRRRQFRSMAAFCAGLLVAALVPLAAGELFVRNFPPEDFQPYLGDDSPLSGPFSPDPVFGVQYRSWEIFKKDYEGKLWPFLPYIEGPVKPPCWALFGNSFVQAPGMLADTARARMPAGHERMVFNLGRNEDLIVRLAQIRLLLAHGLRCERIFVVLLPLDLNGLAQHRLADTVVNKHGAVTFRPRDPGGVVGRAIRNSRLALTGWVRTSQQYSDPDYRPSHLVLGPAPLLRGDLEHLLRGLAEVSSAFATPITIVLLPNYEQIVRGASFELQDRLGEMVGAAGLDCCDVRAPLLTFPEKKLLFIPDKHFSELGNQLVFEAILSHLRSLGADPERLDDAGTSS